MVAALKFVQQVPVLLCGAAVTAAPQQAMVL